MLELVLCSMLTVLPDFLYRRFVQGKRLGREITLFTVWFELRWGITLCLILTVSLITTIFYFHPSTMAATSAFRTVTITTELIGTVDETFVELNQRVQEGQPLFRLDSTAQEAALETARRRIKQVEASMVVARSELRESEARVAQARGALEQATDEFETRSEANRLSPGTIPLREVERARVAVETARAALDASLASRDAVVARIEFQLPTEKTTAEGALQEAQVALNKTLISAQSNGILQQFAVKPGDVLNPMLRPAGILVPERGRTGLLAGFGQIESRVMRVGMIGEVTCIAKPWSIIPVVVTEVQDVIATGQVKPTDTLIDVQQLARPGTITVILEPLYEGQLDFLPQGGSCIANAYTNNHEALADPSIGTLRRFVLHAIDTVGVVHAMILRIQALILPFKTLVFGGH
jgi:multidrug resistance efflux pump